MKKKRRIWWSFWKRAVGPRAFRASMRKMLREMPQIECWSGRHGVHTESMGFIRCGSILFSPHYSVPTIWSTSRFIRCRFIRCGAYDVPWSSNDENYTKRGAPKWQQLLRGRPAASNYIIWCGYTSFTPNASLRPSPTVWPTESGAVQLAQTKKLIQLVRYHPAQLSRLSGLCDQNKTKKKEKKGMLGSEREKII